MIMDDWEHVANALAPNDNDKCQNQNPCSESPFEHECHSQLVYMLDEISSGGGSLKLECPRNFAKQYVGEIIPCPTTLF